MSMQKQHNKNIGDYHNGNNRNIGSAGIDKNGNGIYNKDAKGMHVLI